MYTRLLTDEVTIAIVAGHLNNIQPHITSESRNFFLSIKQ